MVEMIQWLLSFLKTLRIQEPQDQRVKKEFQKVMIELSQIQIMPVKYNYHLNI